LWNSLGPGRDDNDQHWLGARLLEWADGSYHWTWDSDGAKVNDGWTNWAPNQPPSDALAQEKIYMCTDRGWIKSKDGPEAQWYACKQDNPDNPSGYRYSTCCNFAWTGKKRYDMFGKYQKNQVNICTTTTTTTMR
jgi:hypothetical protein